MNPPKHILLPFPLRLARILTVYATLTFSFVVHAEQPPGYNPHGQFGQHNIPLGNAAANIRADALKAGSDDAVQPFADATDSLGAQQDRAFSNTEYCDRTMNTAEQLAECHKQAAHYADTNAWAARSNARPEMVASPDFSAGKADRGQKLGEATRLSKFGAVLIIAQRESILGAAKQIVKGRRALNGVDIATPEGREFLRTKVIQDIKVRAALLMLEHYDALGSDQRSFEIAADFNNKGTRTLADDEDPTDSSLAQRFGPVSRAVSMGNGREAPVSTTPPVARPVGPPKFASRPQDGADVGFDVQVPTGTVAIDPVGSPGTITDSERMSPEELVAAQQLAYDTLRAEGITPSDLLGSGPLAVGKIETVKAFAPAAPLTPGELKAPAFDRASAEAAADRFMEIQNGRIKAPKKLEAQEMVVPSNTSDSSALFGRASDIYQQFPAAVR